MKVTLHIVVRCQSGVPVAVDIFLDQDAAEAEAEGYRDACDFDDEIDAVEVFKREVNIPGVVGHSDF